MSDFSDKAFFRQRWFLFSIVSLIFFLITAATFTSLGVVLPYMVADLEWSWLEAGTGFSIMALMVGLAATVPAYLLRKFGIKIPYLIGGVLLAVGAVLMATTVGLTQYYVGAAVLGFGYSLCAIVPAVHMLNNWMPDRQSFVIGAYMMIGGLGGVAGPFMVTSTVDLTGSWHAHWWTMAISILVLTALAVIFLKESPEKLPDSVREALEKKNDTQGRVHKSSEDWTFKAAIRTPQYYIVVFSLTLILLCGVTMNTWAFTHMTSIGVTASVAATALSVHAIINALARIVGGMLADYIDPKWLLVSALVANMVGMLGLANADSSIGLILFIIGEGYGFGMCFFATTMLLVNYYGAKASPEVIGTMNFITTLAMVGPAIGGMMADNLGSFVWVFRGCALLLLVFLIFVVVMRPPRHENEKARV